MAPTQTDEPPPTLEAQRSLVTPHPPAARHARAAASTLKKHLLASIAIVQRGARAVQRRLHPAADARAAITAEFSSNLPSTSEPRAKNEVLYSQPTLTADPWPPTVHPLPPLATIDELVATQLDGTPDPVLDTFATTTLAAFAALAASPTPQGAGQTPEPPARSIQTPSVNIIALEGIFKNKTYLSDGVAAATFKPASLFTEMRLDAGTIPNRRYRLQRALIDAGQPLTDVA